MKKTIAFTLLIALAVATFARQKKNIQLQSIKKEMKSEHISSTITIDFPTGSNAFLTRNLREYVNEALGGTYSGNIADSTALLHFYTKMNFDSLQSIMQSPENAEAPTAEGMYSCSITRLEETEKYVTMQMAWARYTGGAHEFHEFSAATFRKTDGRKFGYDMFRTIDNDFYNLLKEGLRSYFEDCEQGKRITDEELKEMIFPENNINFLPRPVYPPYLTQKGVAFVYQPYEITPWAAGMPTFIIPYEKISHLLTATVKELIGE